MIEGITEPLVQWYQKDHRILPWRESKNPYYIWISEIMLQQTRVEAVKPFFERFIKALPTVEDVAKCPEEQLLKLWEGLGYYNRVRNIQKAAVRIVKEYGGVLPADYQKLKDLPGIGSYTAGAVASIAYGIPVPAVDGNVLRVYARITESYDDILKQSVKTRVEGELLKVMPKDCPGDLNQALMELGATVCVPNGIAKCEICPVAHLCKARANHTVMELPVKKKAKERRRELKTVLVIRDGERVAIRKRPSKGLLAGLYELPNLEGHLKEDQILEWMKEYRLTPLRIQPLADSKHIFSHVEWEMIGYVVKVAALDREKQKDMLFVEIADVEKNYPVPAAFHAYASYMNMKLGMSQEKMKYERKVGNRGKVKVLSVAVPCYNSQEYMKNCIESLLVGGEEVEIIIVDDGSKDDTLRIAKEYEQQYPGIVKAVHQENKGHGGAVNTGLANATGLYFKVVDSDDWLNEEAYKKVLETLKACIRGPRTLDLMICNYVYEKVGVKHKAVMRYRSALPQDKIFGWEDVKALGNSHYLLMHSMIYRTELLKECGLKLPEHTFYVDNLVAFIPLSYVSTMYYLDVNLYRYFIGREDQSVSEKVMIGRIDQQIRVNKLMIDHMAQQKNLNRNQRDYMMHMLIMITTVSSIFLIQSKTEENFEKKKELWNYLKESDKKVYLGVRLSLLGRLCNLPGKSGRQVSVAGYKVVQKIYGFN